MRWNYDSHYVYNAMGWWTTMQRDALRPKWWCCMDGTVQKWLDYRRLSARWQCRPRGSGTAPGRQSPSHGHSGPTVAFLIWRENIADRKTKAQFAHTSWRVRWEGVYFSLEKRVLHDLHGSQTGELIFLLKQCTSMKISFSSSSNCATENLSYNTLAKSYKYDGESQRGG